ncbi:dephospho-CoA kinase [Psychromonas sp. MME2]|uniref:dephospho-CoA kinase n=1 Tax=Psychromonas sp. MME2 TaxID=3231033 RepID=UPI00339BBB4B
MDCFCFFSALNVTVIDADILAREVVAKGQPALISIEQHFGREILIEGELNRALLREIIFHDAEQKKWLEALLHPLIRHKISQQLAQSTGRYILLEAPLLFENKLDDLTDYNLVVDIEPELQVLRASRRDDVSAEQIKVIVASQISREKRLKQADFVINNSDKSLNELKNSVLDLDKRFNFLQKKENC